jgi:hypothetical protein
MRQGQDESLPLQGLKVALTHRWIIQNKKAAGNWRFGCGFGIVASGAE